MNVALLFLRGAIVVTLPTYQCEITLLVYKRWGAGRFQDWL